ncbi:MAG: hypothetical protein ACE5I3_05705 [Phycisphaerae bacterium]
MKRLKVPRVVSAGCLLGAAACGCVLGPTALQASRVRYNEAIQETTTEQLLLNLVRLQYRESPLFLGVGSVSAQFRFEETADLSGAINEGPNPINPDRLGLGAGVGYEERPTITFAPLQGRDFVRQLLSPLPLDAILLLSHSGWSVDRVLRLTVQTMNGLDNASRASGPTPADVPRYKDFARVSGLLRQLQKKGLLELGYESREDDVGIPVPLAGATLPDVVSARSQGYSVRVNSTGESLIVTGSSRVLVWRKPPPPAAESPEVIEIVELLGLDPDRSSYDIQLAIGRQPEVKAAPGKRTQINIATRSLMGTLFYLSQAVQVPEPHRHRGVVTTTRDADGQPFDWTLLTGDLLRVHSQRTQPSRAAVAVRHRGYWYYIDDADLTSKSTFGFLAQLFALQAGAIEGVAPVLTLPVGG